MVDQAINNDQKVHLVDAGNNNDDLVEHELDIRDRRIASSSTPTHSFDQPRRQNYKTAVYEEIPVPENADSMIKALFVAINLANYMILA